MNKFLGIVSLIFAVMPHTAWGQEKERSELTLSAAGLFPSESDKNGVKRFATDSGAVLFSCRFWLTNADGFEFNYTHARDSQLVSSTLGQNRIHAGVHEVTGAYLRRFSVRGRVRPFLLAGAGIVQYNPIASGSAILGATSQNKPTLLFGGGADYTLSEHFAVRLQFRELVHPAASFGLEPFRTNTWVHIAEPTIGFTYRF
jgi:hypothetical protein